MMSTYRRVTKSHLSPDTDVVTITGRLLTLGEGVDAMFRHKGGLGRNRTLAGLPEQPVPVTLMHCDNLVIGETFGFRHHGADVDVCAVIDADYLDTLHLTPQLSPTLRSLPLQTIGLRDLHASRIVEVALVDRSAQPKPAVRVWGFDARRGGMPDRDRDGKPRSLDDGLLLRAGAPHPELPKLKPKPWSTRGGGHVASVR